MMNRYTCYKSINLPGLKVIPENWNINKLSRICYMKGRIGWQGLKQSEFTTEGPYLITGMNFKDGKIRWDEVYHITEARYNEAPEIQLKAGDVLITKDGTIGKLLYVDTLPDKASLNSHLLVLRPLNNDFQPKYLYYLLRSEVFNTHIELFKTGTTFYGISQEAVGRFRMILPSLKEQEVIVNYLDYKLLKIDELISKKQKLINLLQEERAANINQAVTKGINPHVEMKDSGIEWLEDIPEHWKINKLKYLIKGQLTNGIFKKNEYFGNGTKIINVIDLYNNDYLINAEKLEKVQLTKEEIQKYNAGAGDILFVRSSLKLEGIATSSLIEKTDVPLVYECHVIKITTDKTKVNPIFLINYLNCETIKRRLISLSQTTTMTTISQEKIASLEIILPTLEEQEIIVQYIFEKNAQIFRTMTTLEKEIDLLKEYRAALISEVVTGKIDVREEVASWT